MAHAPSPRRNRCLGPGPGSLHCTGGRPAPGDEQALRGLATQFEHAWNTHDIICLARSQRRTSTSSTSPVSIGKEEPKIIREHAERHKVRFKNSIWTTEHVNVQFLNREMELVHLDWQTRGDLDFDLKPWPPRKGIFSWLVVKDAASWRIRSVQNTEKN